MLFTPPPKPPSQGGFGLNILPQLFWALRWASVGCTCYVASSRGTFRCLLGDLEAFRLLLKSLLALAASIFASNATLQRSPAGDELAAKEQNLAWQQTESLGTTV